MEEVLRVQRTEDGRGQSTVALKDFDAGEVLLREACLAVTFEASEAPWAAELRRKLKAMDGCCAWQYCLAVRCLSHDDPVRWEDFEGLEPLSAEGVCHLEELCGADAVDETSELSGASDLARCCLEHLKGPPELAFRLDQLAGRVARNGFQVVDLRAKPPCPGDALFHRVSFFNHCCAGLSNATWTWSLADGLTVKTSRKVLAGEELTISYISKPWCDLARPARRKYLKQNFNFVCLCKACVAPRDVTPRDKPRPQDGQKGLAQLLLRWMKEGEDAEDAEDDGSDAATTVGTCVQAPQDGPYAEDLVDAEVKQVKDPTVALSQEQRVERLLARCEKENLQVSTLEALEVLKLEEGHVGKSMIRLRREKDRDSNLATANAVIQLAP